MKIHTVMGTTGEYSDQREWPVVSFFDEEKAKEHITKATERAKEWEAIYQKIYDKYAIAIYDDDLPDLCNEYDPNMLMNMSTGTAYHYITTEIADFENMCDTA